MEKKEVKTTRVYYMYYWWNGKRERSKEYSSFAEFVKACGEWCDANPFSWELCHRDVRMSVG